MRICLSTGYAELNNYWGDWLDGKQVGGSERCFLQLARVFHQRGHAVTCRVPFRANGRVWEGCRFVDDDAPGESFDRVYCFDDYDPRDDGPRVLVAMRSDPIRHNRFDAVVALSNTHAKVIGAEGAKVIGCGVNLSDYASILPRTPRMVLYSSSPDRGGKHAAAIGKNFSFVATYRGAQEVTRDRLVELQKRTMVQIHPCDPIRPSEFFGISILEAMAAGTPCVISDADALPEVWGDSAIVLPRPIRYGQWYEEIESLMTDRWKWLRYSGLGWKKSKDYDWERVADRYLEVL